MDLQTRKIEFLQAFLKLDNEEIISQLAEFLRSKASASEYEFETLSIVAFNQRIDSSLLDSKNEKITASKDLLAEIDTWK